MFAPFRKAKDHHSADSVVRQIAALPIIVVVSLLEQGVGTVATMGCYTASSENGNAWNAAIGARVE